MPETHQFSKKKPCYFCGAPPPSGREHAPPKMMFEAFNCRHPIVVPSCDEHNTEKAQRDRAIIYGMLSSLNQQISAHTGDALITENVTKAIETAKAYFPEAKRLLTLQPMVENAPNDWDDSWPRIGPSPKIGEWIRQLTAAVAWPAVGHFDPQTNWKEAILRTNSWFPTDKPEQKLKAGDLVRHLLAWERDEVKWNQCLWYPGWNNKRGEYPSDIYRAEISFQPSHWLPMEGNTFFRHSFYNSLTWYVSVRASCETQKALIAMVEDE